MVSIKKRQNDVMNKKVLMLNWELQSYNIKIRPLGFTLKLPI